jgi:hypothetical protein
MQEVRKVLSAIISLVEKTPVIATEVGALGHRRAKKGGVFSVHMRTKEK